MPTGYTANLTTESAFRDFALSVARRFGALIHMRDEPSDAPLTLPKPSDFYTKSLARSEAKLVELRAMTLEQAEAAAQAEYEEELRREAQARVSGQARRDAYRAMLAKVEAWQPPTSEHVGLKQDMVRQLTESDHWDCGFLDRPSKGQLLTASDWLTDSLRQEERDVQRYREGAQEEQARTAERRQWVLDLQDSLPA